MINLLISLLSYGEVLALLLLVKLQNLSLLSDKLICLSLSLYFCDTINYMVTVMFTWLVNKTNNKQWEDMCLFEGQVFR